MSIEIEQMGAVPGGTWFVAFRLPGAPVPGFPVLPLCGCEYRSFKAGTEKEINPIIAAVTMGHQKQEQKAAC